MQMKDFSCKELTLCEIDHWCRALYFERLKTLDLKDKKILELGFDKGEVTEKLIKEKDYYKYDFFDSIDANKEAVDNCIKKIPNHNFINCCITSKNIESFLGYDTYLVFYAYMYMYHNEMINILDALVNKYNKEVILYESLIDEFSKQTNVSYESVEWYSFLRLHIDKLERTSNRLFYEKYFNPEYKNGFIYLHPKSKQ